MAVSNVTTTSATIYWSTDKAADSQVQYGTTVSYGNLTTLDPSLVTQHVQTLSGLLPGTIYHYWLLSRDADGNLAPSQDFQFMTITSPNRPPPTVSAVTITNITSSGATISWVTDLTADSQVLYGLTSAYGAATTLDPTLVALHSQTLGALRALTTYHFEIRSKDVYGNLGMSADMSFTTLPGPPAISGISISAITTHSATISWTTDIPADSQVAYGPTAACGLSSALNPAMLTSHTQQLEGLTLNTPYYFRVQSRSASGFLSVSSLGNFSTNAVAPLMIPRLVTTPGSGTAGVDDSMFTGIAVSNLGPAAAALTFTAYDTTGAQIAGANIVNPATRTLPPGGQLGLADIELFGSGMLAAQPVGWIDIASSGDQVTGFATFYNHSGSLMDGAPVITSPATAMTFPEIDDQNSTILFVANPNAAPANIQMALVQSDGTTKSLAVRSLYPLGAMVESLVTLFPGVVPDVTDSIAITSDVGLIANEMLGGPYRDAANLNGMDQTLGATTLYCPQYVVGSQYRSTLSIVNTGGLDGNISISLFGDDGVQIGKTQTLPIKASGKIYIPSASFFGLSADASASGYVVVASDGPAIAGSVVFEDSALATFKTALPLVSELDTSLVFSDVVSNSQYFTGVALLNPNDAEVVATIELYRADGSLDTSASLTIPAHRRISEVLAQIFPATANRDVNSGYIRVSASAGLAGFSVFGTNDMKVLAAVPAQIVR